MQILRDSDTCTVAFLNIENFNFNCSALSELQCLTSLCRLKLKCTAARICLQRKTLKSSVRHSVSKPVSVIEKTHTTIQMDHLLSSIKSTLFPGSLFFPIPGEREAETLVWVGNVSWRIEIAREWTSNLKAFVPLLLSKSKQGSRMFSSLQFAISNSCYSSISLKAKQVKCLQAIYCGQM